MPKINPRTKDVVVLAKLVRYSCALAPIVIAGDIVQKLGIEVDVVVHCVNIISADERQHEESERLAY